MKKILTFAMLSFITILLSGCNNNEEVFKTCKLTQSTSSYTMSNEYQIYGSGDVVEKVISVEKITSDDVDILNNLKDYTNELYSNSNEVYGGYEYNLEIQDNTLTSTATIDYNKMNLKKYIEDNNISEEYVNDDNKLLLDGIIKIYNSIGAECE